MSSLLALLAQQTPNLQTRKGLILLGLQNDFLSPDGKLPVSPRSGYLERLKELVPAFREFGDVIWVRSEFEANRSANAEDDNSDAVIAGSRVQEPREAGTGTKRKASQDSSVPAKKAKAVGSVEDDPELFLTRTASREPCCVKGSWGAEYPDDIKALMDEKDVKVTKTYYSGFGSTSLLLTLRSKLITELFVCGCNTNLSVFATAMDAARYGIQITLIEDCLGYRRRERHDEAIRQLVDIMEADVISSNKVVDILKNPPTQCGDDDDAEDDESDEEDDFNNEAHRPTAPKNDDMAADSEDEEEEFVPDVRTTLAKAYEKLALRDQNSPREAALAPQRPPAAEDRGVARSQPATAVRSSSATDQQPKRQSSTSSRRPNRNPPKASRTTGDSSLGATLTRGLEAERIALRESAARKNRGAERPWLRVKNDSSATHSKAAQDLTPRSSHPGLAALSSVGKLDQKTVDEYERAMHEARSQNAKWRQSSKPLFGEEKELESAGSHILFDLLPEEHAGNIFDTLHSEVQWQRMHHQTGEVPRLVCCQGNIAEDGSRPVYRHPSDHTLPLHPWTSAVDSVHKAAETAVGHPLNHALIQLYRGGVDYISEHSDKTLDIEKGSKIVNVSFGAQRTMRLRTKRIHKASRPAPPSKPSKTTQPNRTTYRVPMPHNSMITMSLETNAEFLHGINPDKRPSVEFTDAEKAYNGHRISLTFRHISTFLSKDEKLIWGQGATGKVKDDAQPVINGHPEESEKLVWAFGAENQASGIDWHAVYGEGSDVLHLK
ncbi:hypothetical protein KC340_g8769 [Hortaea werneckii]|nr:hypothetical protein KC342_g8735 [Hortaea werneckii]KAI7100010.1 hypothetical protein KC339_g7783 [Hortaea werneckii]KAI7235033.1 hypothetical protein KC365_g5732 [Hortaea werneckii]KAI7316002.1 hypothetical protein KC340_g8769 [Hortaea werneckii]KAI7381646.1 hypothetical protein KC328_g12107 [Hortaea werneckii]